MGRVTGEEAEVTLSSGHKIMGRAVGGGQGGGTTLAVRPEHAEIVPPEEGLLKGTLQNVVYFGTDTHYHIDLGKDQTMVIRAQNRPGGTAAYAEGDTVGVTFPPGVGQILKD